MINVITTNKTIKISIFIVDTKESIIQRISAYMKTLPEYLIFEKDFEFPILISEWENKEIRVKNLIDEIKEYTEKTYLFSDFINYILQQNISMQLISNYNEILIPFLVYNSFFNDLGSNKEYFMKLKFDDIDDDVKKVFYSNIIPSNILKNIEKYLEIINQKIEINKKNANKELKQFNEFEKINETTQISNFIIEQVKYTYFFKTNINNIDKIFDIFHLSPNIPTISFNKKFKIINDYNLTNDIFLSNTFEDNNTIYFQFFLESQKVSKSMFGEITINENNELKIIFQKELDKINILTKENFEILFFQILKNSIVEDEKISFIKSEEINFSGVFLLYKQSMNVAIFSDLILNNSILSNFFTIRENERKGKSALTSLYINFRDEINAILTYQLVEKNKEILKIWKPLPYELDIDDSVVRVKVNKIPKLENILNFQIILAKTFVLYSNNFDEIRDFYVKYIPNFDSLFDIRKKRKEKKLKLKDCAPDLFIAGYPKRCANPPIVVEYEDETTMVYPKIQDAQEMGVESLTYKCPSPNFPFPGLRDNPLENKDLYKYLPCCYISDQSKILGSKYREYYFDEERNDQSQNNNEIITTTKILYNNNYGLLPTEIISFLTLHLPFEEISSYNNIQYMFLRVGTHRNKSSFWNCVLNSLNFNKKFIEQTEQERNKIIEDLRNRNGIEKIANLCKQTLYNYTTKDIINLIKDTSIYFDPKYFIPLLSETYKCNIFVIHKNKNNEISLIVPEHKEGLYQKIYEYEETKNIIIYEHYGSNNDFLDYPQCELIIQWNNFYEEKNPVYVPYPAPKRNKDKITPLFTEEINYEFVQNIKNIYFELSQTIILSKNNVKILHNTLFPLYSDKINILSQKIDSFGKCRYLKISFNNTIFSIYTSPLFPLPVNEQEMEILPITESKVLKFIQELNTQFYGYNIIKNHIFLFAIIGDVEINIPIVEKNLSIFNLQKINKIIDFQTNDSIFEKYKKVEGETRKIKELFLMLYSKYFNKKYKDIIINISLYDDFVNDNIHISNDIKYENQKLFLSQEILDRLKKILEYEIRYFSNNLQYYYKEKHYNNMYLYDYDFKEYKNQIIIIGLDNLNKFYQFEPIDKTIYNNITNVEFERIFFQNPNILNNEIFILEKCNENNINECIQLLQKYYNIDETSFNLYIYIDENNISNYKSKTYSKFNILQYYYENIVYYFIIILL